MDVNSCNLQVTVSTYVVVCTVMVRTLNLRLQDHCFDFRQVVRTWMGDCLWTDIPSQYIKNIKVNSFFHPPE